MGHQSIKVAITGQIALVEGQCTLWPRDKWAAERGLSPVEDQVMADQNCFICNDWPFPCKTALITGKLDTAALHKSIQHFCNKLHNFHRFCFNVYTWITFRGPWILVLCWWAILVFYVSSKICLKSPNHRLAWHHFQNHIKIAPVRHKVSYLCR